MDERQRFVIAYETFYDCPVHDGGNFAGMYAYDTIQEIKNFILDNLNNQHVLDILDLDGEFELSVSYHSSGHKYVGATLTDYKNPSYKTKTVDNGSGSLIWKDDE